jgi:NitT/TauT family transport system ATP-binding protein
VFSNRPARLLHEVDVAAELGPERTLELRDSDRFFHLRTRILKMVRATSGAAA